nr:MAG TPA: hypothetical protein [Caudoviricetes sp.]
MNSFQESHVHLSYYTQHVTLLTAKKHVSDLLMCFYFAL